MKDIRGQRFGRLVALAPAPRLDGPGRHRVHWKCACDCGGEKVVAQGSLHAGLTTSCGCRHKESAAANMRAAKAKGPTRGNTKHGGHGTPEWSSWVEMRKRCTNTKSPAWPSYGGRGIKVCERWLSFENFRTDMGPKPTRAHSLDRRDNDGDYTPENCRWATKVEQANNRRSSQRITANGVTQTLAEWARATGIKMSTIGERIRRRRWSPERALGMA